MNPTESVDVLTVMKNTANRLEQEMLDAAGVKEGEEVPSALCNKIIQWEKENTAARAAVAELIEAAKALLPRNLCLSNPNVPDNVKVPMLLTMGEMRTFAAALQACGVKS